MNPNARGNPSDVVSTRQARREFLASKKGSIKDSSLRAYKYPTKHFVEFCEENGIETTGEVNGYLLTRWKNLRREEVKQITVHNNVKHLRVFLKWCERSELMDRHIHEKIKVPDVPEGKARSDDTLRLGHAEDILQFVSTYEYATRKHALFQTLWHTGCRISGAMALDLRDRESVNGDYMLKFRNRKATGTALKNGTKAERNVTITEDLWLTLQDYIEGRRNDVLDDFDREPLFTTAYGRVTRQRAYKDYTALSRPCVTTGDCPHNKDIDTCKAAQSKDQATQCPSSLSLHPIRRGSITYHINQGWPKEKLSERVDVSVEVLNKHYDARTEEKEREGRNKFMDLL